MSIFYLSFQGTHMMSFVAYRSFYSKVRLPLKYDYQKCECRRDTHKHKQTLGEVIPISCSAKRRRQNRRNGTNLIYLNI